MSVHGTARFATRGEVERAGLLSPWKPEAPPDGLLLGWWWESQYDFAPIAYRGDLHQLIVGGTGGGKFTTAIAPLLLGSGLDDSTVVVIDPKGEIAKLAGPFFQKPFGKTASVFFIDPWQLCGAPEITRLNVLDTITLDNPNYVDDARALADAMVIPSGAENTHWDNAARNFLTGIILYVALAPEESGNRDLIRVRDIITQSWALPKAYTGPKRPTLSELVFKYLTSELAGGAVRRAFTSLLNREDKERSGIISSIERDSAWIDSPQMVSVLKGPSLDLKQAVVGGGKYFIVLHPDYFHTHRAWLRLMLTAFAKAMKRYKLDSDKAQHKRWRHIVVDEFATLGEMSFILNDVAVGRGFDVKYHFAVQDLAQLRREYKDGWESFINNSFQRFFAVGDLFTADYVSRLLGSATVESVSTSEGENRSQSQSFGTSRGTSEGTSTPPGIFRFGTHTTGSSDTETSGLSDSRGWSSSRTESPVQRALRTPDEVRRLTQDDQFLFMRGMHPIQCRRPPFWEIFTSLPDFPLKEVMDTVGRQPVDDAERRRFEGWRDGPLLMRPEKRPPAWPVIMEAPPQERMERLAKRFHLPRWVPSVSAVLDTALRLLWGPLLGWIILLLMFLPAAIGEALGITERGAFWVVIGAGILLLALAMALKEAMRARRREIFGALTGFGLVLLAGNDLIPTAWATATYMVAALAFVLGGVARMSWEWWPQGRCTVENILRRAWMIGAGLFAAGAVAFLIRAIADHPSGIAWNAVAVFALIAAAALAGGAMVLVGGWLAYSAWHLAAPAPTDVIPASPPNWPGAARAPERPRY